MATFIILGLIGVYSIFALYRHTKNKLKGRCDDSCSRCTANGACPAQSLRYNEQLAEARQVK